MKVIESKEREEKKQIHHKNEGPERTFSIVETHLGA